MSKQIIKLSDNAAEKISTANANIGIEQFRILVTKCHDAYECALCSETIMIQLALQLKKMYRPANAERIPAACIQTQQIPTWQAKLHTQQHQHVTDASNHPWQGPGQKKHLQRQQ